MTWIDWAIILIVGYNFVTGLMSGFIRTAFGFVAMVVASVGNARLAPYLEPAIRGYLPGMPAVVTFLAYALAWILLYIVVSLVGTVIWRLVRKTGLAPADRMMGGALGFVIGALVVLLPIALVEASPALRGAKVVQDARAASALWPWAALAAPLARSLAQAALGLDLAALEKKVTPPAIPNLFPGQPARPAASAKPGSSPAARPTGKASPATSRR